jgi:hypothetical protein
VLVWLNPRHFEPEEFQNDCEKHCQTDFDLQSAKLAYGFGLNKYWHRMWIIQEVLLAKAVTIYYGHHVIPWQHLTKVFDGGSLLSPWDSTTLSWLVETLKDASFLHRRRLHLSDALWYCQWSSCSEPRDALYSLQGLIEEELKVEIDYRKPVMEVLADGAIALLFEGASKGDLAEEEAQTPLAMIDTLSLMMTGNIWGPALIAGLSKRGSSEGGRTLSQEELNSIKRTLLERLGEPIDWYKNHSSNGHPNGLNEVTFCTMLSIVFAGSVIPEKKDCG